MVNNLAGKKALVAKLGMDAHWRGAIVIANMLRDAGMEVVYLGHASAEEIAQVALQEDPALIGLSSLSGSHLAEVPAVMSALSDAGIDPVVVAGGAIPAADHESLRHSGLDGIYPTGSSLTMILDDLGDLLQHH